MIVYLIWHPSQIAKIITYNLPAGEEASLSKLTKQTIHLIRWSSNILYDRESYFHRGFTIYVWPFLTHFLLMLIKKKKPFKWISRKFPGIVWNFSNWSFSLVQMDFPNSPKPKRLFSCCFGIQYPILICVGLWKNQRDYFSMYKRRIFSSESRPDWQSWMKENFSFRTFKMGGLATAVER